MDLKQIQELIRFVAKSGVSEVQLEQDDFKIIIKTNNGTVFQQMPAPAPQVYNIPAQTAAAPQNASSEAANIAVQNAEAIAAAVGFSEEIRSPMIGTFYRRPSPDKPEFIKVGDKVAKGQVVCVIEAMKLFNEIESDVAGTVIKILAEDMTPVEYDQPLFLVEP